MPRHARVLSETQTYHIMLRGNNRQDVFIDDEDKARIIATISEKKDGDRFALYAYCVMDNHPHSVLREGTDPLSRAFKRIGTSYAHYFNFSNDRGKAINAFKKYHQEEAEGFFLDVEGKKRVPEENVQSFISQYLMERKLEIEGLKLPENKKFRDELIGLLRKESGLSLRRIAEVLQINREVVRRAVGRLSKEPSP